MNELEEHGFPGAGYALLTDPQGRAWQVDWFKYSHPRGWWMRFVHLLPEGGKVRYWNIATEDPGGWPDEQLLATLQQARLAGLTSKAEVLHQALNGHPD